MTWRVLVVEHFEGGVPVVFEVLVVRLEVISKHGGRRDDAVV